MLESTHLDKLRGMTKCNKGRTKNWKAKKTRRGEKEKFKEIETYKN